MTDDIAGARRGSTWVPRLTVVVCLGAAIALAVHLGLIGFLSDTDRVEAFLTESGALGPIAYIAVFTLAQPFSIPGVAIIIPATFVWSGLTVFVLSWIGGMVASTIGFAVARWLAQDWVQARLPARMADWEDRLNRDGTRAIILLRVITGFAPAADWLLGVSTVTVRQFLIGTGIGLIPSTAISSFLGDDAVRVAGRLPWLVGGLVLLAGVVVLVRRRRATPTPASGSRGSQPGAS